MKRLLFAIVAVMVLAACHVRHDHSQKMMSVRVAEDSVQVANEAADAAGEDDWMDEDVVEIPDAPEDLKGTAHPEATETIERMLQGKE